MPSIGFEESVLIEKHFFVIATNFHGATLLSKLLNDHSQVIALGDTYPSNLFEQVCGCGAMVKNCQFWQKINQDIAAERYISEPHILPDYPQILGRGLDRLIYNTLPYKVLKSLIPQSSKRIFKDDFERFVKSVYKHGGTKETVVYIDGVKSISRVNALLASGVRVDGIIHIQRDPGDYIKSTMKQEGHTWKCFLKMLLSWRLFHNRARKLGKTLPYISVTYEGLSEKTDATLRAVFDFLGLPTIPLSQLVTQNNKEAWHFVGNASLFHFDGKVKRSQHFLSISEKNVVRILAGDYDWVERHLMMRNV